jgi:hypothetical protein
MTVLLVGECRLLQVACVFDNLDGATGDIVTGKDRDRYPRADKMSRA